MLNEKYNRLKEIIKRYGNAAVALSGGVDSTFLSKVVFDVLRENSAAITVVSPMMSRSELEDAKAMTAFIGIRHVLVEDNEIEEKVAENPVDRCYHCKKIEFGVIQKAAKEIGIEYVFDGSNIDDLSDYRPGLNALKELNIVSPLRDAEFTKTDIREMSKILGLKTWNKSSFACLASRIPYGEKITHEKLSKIDRAEDCLREAGFEQFRVRVHGDVARLEIAPNERTKLFNTELLDKISKKIKSIGFLYVAMELEGYKMGNMNLNLKGDKTL